MSRTFLITEERLLELLQAEDELVSLQSVGVDNWHGYAEAYELFDEELQASTEISDTWKDSMIFMLNEKAGDE